ncbi:MAG: hypothetical protein ACPH5G_17365 [Pseudooceanicola atlanticus]
MSSARPRHKRGTTFRHVETLGFDLSGYEVTAQVTLHRFRADLAVRRIGDASRGQIELSASNDDTQSWPLGVVAFDVTARKGSETVTTPTHYVHIIEEVTR